MLQLRIYLLLINLGTAALGGCGAANHPDPAPASARLQSAPSKRTLPPLEFVSFCMRNSAECRAIGEPAATIVSTPESMAAIGGVNAAINARIRPTTVSAEWRINPASGNCNDYVVSKRHALLARGFPSSALLINVVRTRTGEGHLVLVVRTDRGDLVLDNLTSELRHTSEAPYAWIKRQTTEDPRLWEST